MAREMVQYHGKWYYRIPEVLEAVPGNGSRTHRAITSNRSILGKAGMSEVRRTKARPGSIATGMAQRPLGLK